MGIFLGYSSCSDVQITRTAMDNGRLKRVIVLLNNLKHWNLFFKSDHGYAITRQEKMTFSIPVGLP